MTVRHRASRNPRPSIFEDFDPLEATTGGHRGLKNPRPSICGFRPAGGYAGRPSKTQQGILLFRISNGRRRRRSTSLAWVYKTSARKIDTHSIWNSAPARSWVLGPGPGPGPAQRACQVVPRTTKESQGLPRPYQLVLVMTNLYLVATK